ncbi:MAG: DUF4388 domain-containing protein [Proteobacteria bacterium]|nr:DUF4388 domain-containing protein [Pseudomonadota bacterium]
MKLLAIVEDRLKDVLLHLLGCEIEFKASWSDVDARQLPDYGCIVASGCLIESSDPLVLWGIASEIRYFGILAVFVDVSFEAGNLIPRVYPQIKLASYRGDSSQISLQLRTYAPQLFGNDASFRRSTNSAYANALRFEERINNPLISDQNLGERNSISDVRKSAVSSGGYFGAVSSTLGEVPVPNDEQLRNKELKFSSTLKKTGLGTGRSANVSSSDDFAIDDLAAISGFSVDSAEMNAIEAALDSAHSGEHMTMSDRSKRDRSQISAHNLDSSKGKSKGPVIKRMLQDFLLGSLETGTLIFVIQTLIRLKQTGTLEIRTDTRTLKIEFRQGVPCVSCDPEVVRSALAWESGEYNFNTSQILSLNSKPIQLDKMISSVVHEQLRLNCILKKMEVEFNSYICLTNYFSLATHYVEVDVEWWKKCDGTHRLSEIMMSCGVSMESVSRDIYQSWLCDEIAFSAEPCQKVVKIEYDVVHICASNVDQNSRSSLKNGKSSLDIVAESTDASYLDTIRKELQRVLASFDTEDGYTILGIKPGCGNKALDDAYYAWINRYHTDRFVRFGDASFIKMANDLVMMMNGVYAKLSKAEKQLSKAQKVVEKARIAEDTNVREVSGRIGVGRARTSTIHTQDNISNEQIRNISAELRSIQNNEAGSREQEAGTSQRPRIRPASLAVSSENDLVPRTSRPSSPQVLRMSDVIARRVTPSHERALSENSSTGRSASSRSSGAWSSSTVTPEQHFQTAKKKLTLGLAQDALASLAWALEADPDNLDYIAHHAYAAFLVDPSLREESIERITDVIEKLEAEFQGNLSVGQDEKMRLFAPYYFIGKIHLTVEEYETARDFFTKAAKLNPSDVDTQRCLRYITMQLNKIAEQNKSKSGGLFSRFRDRFQK